MPTKKPPYDINETVNLDIDWYDSRGLADPESFTLRLVKPNGAVINADQDDCERLELGMWRYPYLIDQAGTYKGTWTAVQGNNNLVRQFSFPVRVPDSG